MDATHCVLGLSQIRSYFLAASDVKSSFQDVISYLHNRWQLYHEGWRAWKWSLPTQNNFLFQFIIHLPHCVSSNCADISSRLVSGLTRPYYLCWTTPYGCHPGAKLLQTYIENSPKMFFQNLFAFVCAVVEYKYKMKLMRPGVVRGVLRQGRHCRRSWCCSPHINARNVIKQK